MGWILLFLVQFCNKMQTSDQKLAKYVICKTCNVCTYDKIFVLKSLKWYRYVGRGQNKTIEKSLAKQIQKEIKSKLPKTQVGITQCNIFLSNSFTVLWLRLLKLQNPTNQTV